MQSGVAAADDALHGSPTSYAAAAKTHLPAAAPQAAGGAAPHRAAMASPQRRWRWTDVRELVVYGLGSFESGGRLHSFHGRQQTDVVRHVTRAMGRSCTLSLLSGPPAAFHVDVHVVAPACAALAAGPVPRCQLALTLLLAEAAGGRLATPPQLFDPAFTEVTTDGRYLCHVAFRA